MRLRVRVWFAGAGLGIAAGAVLLLTEVAAALWLGTDPERPVRRLGSVALGPVALERTGLALAAAVGLSVHLALSAVFGAVYAALADAMLSQLGRRSFVAQTLFGALYGVGLWAATFQGVARAVFPWVFEPHPLTHALLHGFAYGAPLGLLLAAMERAHFTVVETPSQARARRERERRSGAEAETRR